MATSLTFIEYVRSLLGILLFILLFLVAIPISFILVLLTFGRIGDFAVKYIAPGIAIPVLRVIGIRFKKVQHGPPTTQPAIYLINHSSTLDIPTMMATAIPKIRFVAKWELQYIPFFFIMGRLTGQVFIKRQNSGKAVATLKKTYTRLKKNNLSLMLGGSLFAKTGDVTSHLHPPIDTSSWKLETIDDHIKEVRDLYLQWAGVEELK